MASGADAIRTYAQSGSGSFALVPSAQTGLVASGTGVACTVGDFDNDGLPDVAVAMSDRVLLFKNHGGGKFTDVTAATGVQPANHPAGITFVDYDHDGDLDLVCDRPAFCRRERSPMFCGATTATAPLPTGRIKRALEAKAPRWPRPCLTSTTIARSICW